MGEGGEEKQGKRNRKRREKEVREKQVEAGKLIVKSIGVMMEIEGMTTKEKADRCIGRESVKEWQARIEEVQIQAMKVAIKVLIEE